MKHSAEFTLFATAYCVVMITVAFCGVVALFRVALS